MEALGTPQRFGRYTLHAKIAQGGMAEVWLATTDQKELHGQFLAIKKLLPHLNSNKPFVNLLIHEAKIGVLLNHPGIVSVFDLGVAQNDFFISMEYIHGKSLDKVFELIDQGKIQKMSPELATYIVLEVIKALTFAHQLKDKEGRELSIIHRDVTPGNILLSYLGDVKLTDFGIATAEHRLTPGFSNVALGKVAYISPEQAANDPAQRASDIFSLGVVYYQLLTGQLPFQGRSANEILKRVIDGKMMDLKITGPELSKDLRLLLTRCLDRSYRQRPQSASELYYLLQALFFKEQQIDYSARSIRTYYKKKLAEYMRSAFKALIFSEIEISQKALKNQSTSLHTNTTATRSEPARTTEPQPKEGQPSQPGPGEATVFEADIASEVTRYYPLTSEERQNILEKISQTSILDNPAHHSLTDPNAVTAISSSSSSSPPPSVIPMPRNAPAAQEEVEWLPAISQRSLSLDDKLRLSSLQRDVKESLKQQKPAVELRSIDEQERFEVETFSGAITNSDLKPRDFSSFSGSVPMPQFGEKTKPAVRISDSRPIAVTTDIDENNEPSFKKIENPARWKRLIKGTPRVLGKIFKVLVYAAIICLALIGLLALMKTRGLRR